MLRQTKIALGLAATALVLPAVAGAQTPAGFYIGAGVGANFVPEGTGLTDRQLASQLRNLNIPTTTTVGTEVGVAGVISAGYSFGNGIRAEIEGSIRYNEAGSTNSASSTASGNGRTYGIMGNALYDIRIASMPWVVPYIGGGVGYAWREADGLTLVDRASGGTFVSSGTQGSFAYQAIGGLAFPIASVPGLSITTEYRYFATNPAYFTTVGFNTRTGERVVAGSTKSFGENHSVMLGVRYAFGQAPRPAPVAAPAPAPAPARTFLVFFDWDRADLTDRARQIIAEAATNARTVRSTRIEVSGHADRTGTAAYNQRLSVRRAEAVAAELVRRGIARNEITVQGFGFDRPLVPTAMGVREPQNRRVEIVLR